jgi:hypothetical protein
MDAKPVKMPSYQYNPTKLNSVGLIIDISKVKNPYIKSEPIATPKTINNHIKWPYYAWW